MTFLTMLRNFKTNTRLGKAEYKNLIKIPVNELEETKIVRLYRIFKTLSSNI